jgi:hypothetical protein
MKQTAVEWLYDQLEFDDSISMDDIEKIFEQAKAMEKAEKDKQYQRGFKDGSKHIKIIYNL